MSATATKSFLYTAIGTGGIVTVPFDVSNYDDASFVFCNDGGGNLTATMQMTNQLPVGDALMPQRMRDDSLASYDWASSITPTTAAVSISGIAANSAATAVVSCQAFRAVRFKLVSASTTTQVRMYAFASGGSS